MAKAKAKQTFDELKIGTCVGFDERPNEFGEEDVKGIVTAISDDPENRWFILKIPETGDTIIFDDGYSWSQCAEFKLHDMFRWDCAYSTFTIRVG